MTISIASGYMSQMPKNSKRFKISMSQHITTEKRETTDIYS